MKKVYAIGETVLDIIFKQNKVEDAKPGGAMLNSSVSLGRTGIDVSLITEFANDNVGEMVNNFLVENNVKTNKIYRHKDGKTSIAMAFLDEKNDASYIFYKTNPVKRLGVETPEFDKEDILLFGSFYGIEESVRPKVYEIVKKAKDRGCLIIYDPNFRKPHAHELEKLLPFIMENIEMADIVRGSDEDFEIIFNAKSIEEVRKVIGDDLPVLIMTKSASGVYLNTQNLQQEFPVEKINPVSTIGAGDNFNAGIIYGIIKESVKNSEIGNLKKEQWKSIVSSGVTFASNVCMSYENYISKEFAEQLK